MTPKSTGTEGATLHAVCAAQPLTAADAVNQFIAAAATRPERQVIGYALSARAATWVRVRPDGTVEDVTDAADILGEAYEMVLFDGERELRWLRTPDGYGTAVALAETRATLPSWEDVPAAPAHRGPDQIRLLAGTPVAHCRPGWTTLRGGRYAAAHLPCPCSNGDVLVVETIEYLVEDEHGNLDVADTRIVGIRPGSLAALRAQTGPSPERTTP